jgi:type IV secretory pathway VirJ component
MRSILPSVMGLWLALMLPGAAAAADRVDMPLRGRTLELTLYRPAGTPRGTIIMGSGDVGWVGLAVSRAQELSADGYVVIGVNVREYLSAFTSKSEHLSPADIQADFGQLSRFMLARGLLPPPVILSGVSEGAGIAVVAAAAAANHEWVSGVITMGLPQLSEIAWRWSDFTSWITKKDAAEPSVKATDFVGGIAPVPLAMIQSKKDEYVPEADYRAIERAAREPKNLMLIDASNHRFTDRIPELRRVYAEALAWIASKTPAR